MREVLRCAKRLRSLEKGRGSFLVKNAGFKRFLHMVILRVIFLFINRLCWVGERAVLGALEIKHPF